MQKEYQRGAIPILLLFFVLLLIFGVFAEPWIVDTLNRGGNTEKTRSDNGQTDLVHATGVYAAKGHSVTVTMSFPQNGGTVTGAVSGECQGTLTGTYAGPESRIIDATARGSCPFGFIKIPGTGSFTGTVSESGNSVDVALYAKALGFSHSGTMSLHVE